MASITVAQQQKLPFNNVVVHPLVLLSVVDHYNRADQTQGQRVCGILLGEVFNGKIDVTNSYAGT
jgi:26S proteasome regulatory subunit N8